MHFGGMILRIRFIKIIQKWRRKMKQNLIQQTYCLGTYFLI